jgi:hypothetical protein
MRTSTAAVILALALAACSRDEARNPLAPSAPNLSAADRTGIPTISTRTHGSLDATETSTPQPAPPAIPTQLATHLEGTGTASHLGRYTVVANLTVDLATASSVGDMTFTTADGDRITATETGQAVFGGGLVRITEVATITGGTGRFARASGTLAIVRLENPATGVSSGSFEGTIDLAK